MYKRQAQSRKHREPAMTTCLSRRRFLRALSLTGAAGFAALHPLSSAAHATVPRTSVLTETRLLMGTMVSVTVSDSSRARMEDALHTVFLLSLIHILPSARRHSGIAGAPSGKAT